LIEGGDQAWQQGMLDLIRDSLIERGIGPIVGAEMLIEIIGLLVREATGNAPTPESMGAEKLRILDRLQTILVAVVNSDMVANDNVILPPGSA
tara:strand:- start:4017 stop:4295 length:279 start_codon:yes stop_codon:yes gene_type:complete